MISSVGSGSAKGVFGERERMRRFNCDFVGDVKNLVSS